MARVVLLTGGNLGDVRATLAGARLKLAERVGAETAASSLWESPPWGFEAPEQFLNQVLIFETALEPEHVLDICQQIEREAGGSVRERQTVSQPEPDARPEPVVIRPQGRIMKRWAGSTVRVPSISIFFFMTTG